MLVPVVVWHESAICIYIYSLPLEAPSLHPPHPSRSSQNAELSSQFCTRASYYLPVLHTVICVYVKATLSAQLTHSFPSCIPQVHSWHLHLYSCPANRFICTIFPDIWYLFFSDFKQWEIIGSSPTSLQIAQFFPFLWSCNIPLYKWATPSFSTPLSTDI